MLIIAFYIIILFIGDRIYGMRKKKPYSYHLPVVYLRLFGRYPWGQRVQDYFNLRLCNTLNRSRQNV